MSFCKTATPFAWMILAVGIAVATMPRAADEEIDTVPATNAARTWLAVVDAGHYADSWEMASEVFRAGVTRPQWEMMAAPVRSKVGNLVQRKVSSVKYMHDLPGAPAGEYVVIQYNTRFENGAFTETVTPMKQADGSWKVSGYYIK
ncbi:MAG TPA: DUF4019 domain-containing protein [Usitatibacter sp.]|jgi:hypothetical protein